MSSPTTPTRPTRSTTPTTPTRPARAQSEAVIGASHSNRGQENWEPKEGTFDVLFYPPSTDNLERASHDSSILRQLRKQILCHASAVRVAQREAWKDLQHDARCDVPIMLKAHKVDLQAMVDNGNETRCAVCLEEYGEEGMHGPVRLGCGHVFGHSCLETWLGGPEHEQEDQEEASTCPMCRRSVLWTWEEKGQEVTDTALLGELREYKSKRSGFDWEPLLARLAEAETFPPTIDEWVKLVALASITLSTIRYSSAELRKDWINPHGSIASWIAWALSRLLEDNLTSNIEDESVLGYALQAYFENNLSEADLFSKIDVTVIELRRRLAFLAARWHWDAAKVGVERTAHGRHTNFWDEGELTDRIERLESCPISLDRWHRELRFAMGMVTSIYFNVGQPFVMDRMLLLRTGLREGGLYECMLSCNLHKQEHLAMLEEVQRYLRRLEDILEYTPS